MTQKPDESPGPPGGPTKPAGAPTTPNRRASAQPGVTPKSAPAAAGHGTKKKAPEPSLLADFLLGRPSPARAGQRSASKQRRKSVALDAAGVREELRQEMRAAAVRRLQQPGGVHDRVKAWQKANKAAMKTEGGGVPNAEDVASEPTEFAAHIDAQSVTEEDRVRIKLRHKGTKKKKPQVEKGEPAGAPEGGKTDGEQSGQPGNEEPDIVTVEPRNAAQPKVRPKKRIVSDDNWMKRNRGKGPAKATATKTKDEGSPTPIPKDFLLRTAPNPSVQSKIKDWAKRVEIPETPETPKSSSHKPPRENPRVKEYHTKTGDAVTVEEENSTVAEPEPKPKPDIPFDDGIRVRPINPSKPKVVEDDGIRIKPIRKKKEPPDDGIRVRPVKSALPDDGIRVRPIVDNTPEDEIRARPSRRGSLDEITVRPASSQGTSSVRSSRTPSPKRDRSPSEVIEVVEDAESEVATPTRRRVSSRRRPAKSRSPMPPITREKKVPADKYSDPGTLDTFQMEDPDDVSEMIPPTVAGNKSLAEIPFGYSAFSELDLPLRTSSKKPKAQRNPSFKGVPNVLKKVMSGAREIIHEKVDPPKPVVKQPPSIETWLSNTVDPFVETPREPRPAEAEKHEEAPRRSVSQPRHKASAQEEPQRRSSSARPREVANDTQKRSTSQSRPKDTTTPEPEKRSASQTRRTSLAKLVTTPTGAENQENADPRMDDSDVTPKKAKTPTTPSTGLKRRRATRSTSSPIKSNGKKPFREALKEAFRGESGGHKLPPTVYPSCETDHESVSDPEHSSMDPRENRRRSTGSSSRSRSPDPSSTMDSAFSSEYTDPYPPRRRPPTKGHYELSTIVSEESSTVISDTISDVSHTTITQATALTKSTELSRQKSHKSSLKRRLTKHSDLISVLSLPGNDDQLIPPSRSKSIKSSRSIHRKPSKLDRGRINDLLDEFADDEHFYGRELKTLVDGVVPVLLKEVIRTDSRGSRGVARAGLEVKQEDATSKAVVNMGVVLERLRNLHRSIPLSDIRHLLTWLETVAEVYDEYLDVWRLGFQDLIVNLAPVQGRFDEEDSLVNALPRNEDGDVLGEHGERVDVAYLLKRPLIRIKWMTKFLKAAVVVLDNGEADSLLSRFEALQEKARKRHREEVARITDEDASNTDTTRARDLRNFAPLDGVLIDPSRQVAAKDSFELDLDHSGGQRLECQVELIYRDKPSSPSDKGDILIRELGNGARSWLLFPPIPKERISARRGEDARLLLVMVRGTHNRKEWFELIKLFTDNDEQILDWLDILGSHPLPPLTRPTPAVDTTPSTPPRPEAVEVPVGERKNPIATSPVTEKKTPSRYHKPSPPVTPGSPASYLTSPSPHKTPTQENFAKPIVPPHVGLPAFVEPRTPSRDLSYQDSAKTARSPPNSTPYREDGAPPPPIHRTLSKAPTNIAPPVELTPARVKRRGSSPLKHEYHPSDVSSDSASSVSDDSESSESSSDELDEDEVPDTIPGYSIKQPKPASAESVISESSITPSASASQVGAKAPDDSAPERPCQKFAASVSYWSAKKGTWKDINADSSTVVVYPGSMEVHRQHRDTEGQAPLLGLILTPVVMIRRSTALDLEVRSPAAPESRLKTDSAMFRFRAASQAESQALYEAVHRSRLNNARYIQLSEEARVRSFGQQQAGPTEGSADGDSSSRRRSFFGRKNSYRASTRAPSISQHSSSTSISATSFLRRLTGGNLSFNIDESSVDKHSRPGDRASGRVGGSLESSSGSSTGGGSTSTPPRSLSISLSGSGGSQSRWSNGLAKPFSPEHALSIRCHLNVQNNRWADKGDCVLSISRPPPGVRQELRLNHGMEKRVIVTHATKKTGDQPLILLDAVLGSKCFSMLGARGIMCSVWENLRDEEGNVGVAPAQGALAGKVTKWCFQCKSAQQASWIMNIVTSEVAGLVSNYP